MSAYSNWTAKRNAYIQARIGPPPQVGPTGASGLDGYTVSQDELDAERAYQEKWAAEAARWRNALSPAERADYDAHMAGHNESIGKAGKIVKVGALGTIAAAGLGAGLTAAGVLGGGAASPFASGAAVEGGAGGALEAANAAGVGSGGGWSGLTIPGAAGGSTIPTAVEMGGGLAAAAPGAAGGAGGAAGVAGGAGSIGGILGSSGILDWGKALLSAGSLGATIAATMSGSDVPGADPRLVEAQLRSMGYQDDAIQSILKNATAQAATNSGLIRTQEQAMQFGLDANKTAYDQIAEDRGYYTNRRGELTNLQDAMVKEAKQFNSESAQDAAAAAAQAGVGKAYSDAIAANARNLASMGISPESGRALALREAGAADLARSGVREANVARLGARNEGRALMDRAAASLAATSAAPDAATRLALAGADIGNNQINIANAGAGGINATYGANTGARLAAGGLAGSLGSQATSMYGAQTSRDVASTAAKNATTQNRYEGYGAILGGATRLFDLFEPTAKKQP